MTRVYSAILLISIVSAASCARARTLRDANDGAASRMSMVGNDLAVRAGPVLRGLPPVQRYRFVSPDSLVTGVASADLASLEEPRVAELRKTVSTVLELGRWVESGDSVQFDVSIFATSRTTLRREGRPQLAANVTTCGDRPTTQLERCTDDPVLYTEQWDTEHNTFLIIRRRSDGAVRVWRGASRVDAELVEMLRAGKDD